MGAGLLARHPRRAVRGERTEQERLHSRPCSAEQKHIAIDLQALSNVEWRSRVAASHQVIGMCRCRNLGRLTGERREKKKRPRAPRALVGLLVRDTVRRAGFDGVTAPALIPGPCLEQDR